MPAASDISQAVIEQAAQGEPGAFADIVRAYQSVVYGIAWNFLRDEALAEELAQDVFLHLYRHIGEIETPGHLGSWLRKVACHRAIDQARRRKYRPRVGLDQAPEPSQPPVEADPLLSGQLERLVADLPERARAIVVLRYQEDLEPTEIAETLHIPVGTVKSNLHRTIALLRSKLERKLKTPAAPDMPVGAQPCEPEAPRSIWRAVL
jgi:RNA polymerase sigma-70 factor (ECF subfamily)